MNSKNYTRKITLIILGIILVVLALFTGKRIVDTNNKPVKKIEKIKKKVFVTTIKNNTIPTIITASGNLIAKKRLELFSEVQGVFSLKNKLFRSGQKYNKGETIIQIDATEYYATVKSQKSNLYQQIAAIMPDLRLDYPAAFPKWKIYLDNFDIDKPVANLPETTSEKVKYFLAARNIISNYYTIKNLETRLSKYRIAAPFSGIVTEALVSEGTLIRPGQKLGEFIQSGIYELKVAVPKEYATLLKTGETVLLNTASSSTDYKGKIIRISGNINQSSQTIDTYIEISDSTLKEGMYLEAKINAQQIENAVEINRNLIQNKEQLFTVKDSVLDIITIEPIYFTDRTAIVKGIPNGTKIINQPILGAYKGMLVEIHKKENTSKETK